MIFFKSLKRKILQKLKYIGERNIWLFKKLNNLNKKLHQLN